MEIYTVKEGDSLYSIAEAFGVTYESLALYNQLSTPSKLVVGQHILILKPSVTYRVRPGDSLREIAASYGTTAAKLLQNNPQIYEPDSLYEGQEIVIDFESNPQGAMSVNGYAYPNIDIGILRQTLPYLTYLTIFSYGFTDEGELLTINDEELISLAKDYGTGAVMLISPLSENGSFSNELASKLINNTEIQEVLIEQIISNMKKKGYIGLDMDFEFIYPQDAEGYAALIEKLMKRLNEEGLFILTGLAPKTSDNQQGLLYEGHNYSAIGSSSNVELIMTYEWGYTYGPPMAVAPLNKVREVVEYAVSRINPRNIYMGMPNYGYDWTLPYVKGETAAQSISNVEAINRAVKYEDEIKFDQTAQSPYFMYKDENGRLHEVWFEDALSVLGKVRLAQEFNLAGLSYWNIMRPFLQNWLLLSSLTNINKIY